MISKLKLAILKPFLPTSVLLIIFHSHLNYILNFWRFTSKSYYKRLISLQNKTVKLIDGGKWYDKAISYYSKLNIKNLSDLITFEMAVFVYKSKEKKPSLFIS